MSNLSDDLNKNKDDELTLDDISELNSSDAEEQKRLKRQELENSVWKEMEQDYSFKLSSRETEIVGAVIDKLTSEQSDIESYIEEVIWKLEEALAEARNGRELVSAYPTFDSIIASVKEDLEYAEFTKRMKLVDKGRDSC